MESLDNGDVIEVFMRGKFRNILKSPITVVKETGQYNNPLVMENIIKMYGYAEGGGNFIWLASPSLFWQFGFAFEAVGTGNIPTLKMGTNNSFSSLFGLPLFWDKCLPAAGSEFDIVLVNLSKFFKDEPCSVILQERK